MLFYIDFRWTSYIDNHILYKVAPWYFQHQPITMHSYYNITDYIPHAIFYIPITILLPPICIFLIPSPFSSSLPTSPPPLWQPSVCTYESLSILFVHFFLIWCSKSLSLNSPFLHLQVSPSPACTWWSSHTELLLERHIHAGFSCKKCPTIVWTPGWSLDINSSIKNCLNSFLSPFISCFCFYRSTFCRMRLPKLPEDDSYLMNVFPLLLWQFIHSFNFYWDATIYLHLLLYVISSS